MLREIYTAVGGVGAFFVAIAMFLSFVGWWMAVTGTVMRTLPATVKALLVVVVSLFPPLSIVLISGYLVQDRRTAKRAEAIRLKAEMEENGFDSSSLIPVPVREAA